MPDAKLIEDVKGKEEEKAEVLSTEPQLRVIPPTEVLPHKAIFVGECKLASFKQLLTDNGIPAELASGVLSCYGGTVTIKKDTGGMGSAAKYKFEGGLSEEYFKIRDLLYSQFTIL
eukprot:TRINITY_DN40277_c1_g1_i4.p1 TRINITY_DN40277_c1_g1~~TRINITY_DN40277_c1_g1_i4.p1  ORF type:complete len:124 (+),score=22.30 TRINITY_DN40277_c1_g1_i4:25-372(+)